MQAQGGHREVRQCVTGADANLVARVAGRVQEAWFGRQRHGWVCIVEGAAG